MNNLANFGQHFAAIQQSLIGLTAKIQQIERQLVIVANKVENNNLETSPVTVPANDSTEEIKSLSECFKSLEVRVKIIEDTLVNLDSIFSPTNSLPPTQVPIAYDALTTESSAIQLPVEGSTLNLDEPQTTTAPKKKAAPKKK